MEMMLAQVLWKKLARISFCLFIATEGNVMKSHFTQITYPYMRILSDDQIEEIHSTGSKS